VVTSNRCLLVRSPNIGGNIIQNLLGAVSRCAEFHIGLLIDDTMFTKLQFACSGTFQQSFLCKSLQRLFTCMSEPHIPQPGRIIIWICRSHHLTCNCTTLQVVEIILVDAIQNYHWVFSHHENIISYRYLKTQCFQNINWDKIHFKWRYIPHFLQFPYHPIKHLNMNCTYSFHVTWVIITHDNRTSI